MIKATRVVVDGSKTYDNCMIYMPGEIDAPDLFEDNQLVLVDSTGKHIVSSFSISCIELDKRMSPPKDSIKATRINISSDITFSPVWIIDYRYHNIPDIFGYPFQFTFIDNEKKVYITTDVSVALVDL